MATNVRSHIQPVRNPAWLYVPFAQIVVPVDGITPVETFYLLQELGSGNRFLTENGDSLFILESGNQ